jgi:hypothetical protein
MSTSAFSKNTLEAISSAFNSNSDYNCFKFTNPNTGQPDIISLTSFLGNPNYSGLNVDEKYLETIYNGLIYNINSFITSVTNNTIQNYNFGIIHNFRIVIALADGNIFFDSSKGAKNTYSNFLNKIINENHGTRHYIQEAFHSKNGISYETKWSSSTRSLDTYFATRCGMSPQGIIAIIAFSYSNSY